ncbi:hypothetical protein [Chryseobacterium sp. JK1]|uniref:hypothetical protein n=1 Tax=Chryseobacterium sp. JK1 TaxID=874294 RepID=UPI003D69B6F4
MKNLKRISKEKLDTLFPKALFLRNNDASQSKPANIQPEGDNKESQDQGRRCGDQF